MSQLKESLQGLRVLNTRPLKQGKALSDAITRTGGFSIEFPTLEIEPTSTQWRRHLPKLSLIDQVIFISANAVNYFFAAGEFKQWPKTIKIIAIGKASVNALEKKGIQVDYCPHIADSEHLLQLNTLSAIKNQSILLIKGEGGRPLIEQTLLSRGAHVISLHVYRRIIPHLDITWINSLWQHDAVDIILGTSQQSLYNLFTLFGENARTWLCSKPCLVISSRLEETATALGIKTIISSRYDTIIKTLAQFKRIQK